MILKGQNFRIYRVLDSATCIGMATNCTVTLTNNTENAATKDDKFQFQKPTTLSKGWTVSVDSLDVVDMAGFLATISSSSSNYYTLMWDETSATDNQTRIKTAFARKGAAILTDVNLTFNDRENSAKSLQFTGTGPLATVPTSLASTVVASAGYTKGQNVRFFLSSDNSAAPAAVIAAAKQLSLHVSRATEPATTKDTTGDYLLYSPGEISYDISTTALMRGDDTITSSVAAKAIADIEAIYEAGTPVKWKIANTDGDNNRTAGTTICSGSVVLTQLTLNGPNGQNADYTAQFAGYGTLTVDAA